jgi:large subunit ribosomal protein L10
MNRSQKEVLVTQLAQDVQSASAAFLVNYQGSQVSVLHAFRKQLRSKEATFRVAKARLLKLAFKDTPGGEEFGSQLREQIGVVLASGSDVSAVAKEMVGFAKSNGTVKVLAGLYESKVLSKDDVAYFATLPSREVLLATVAGTLQAPIAQFVRLLNQLIVRLLYVLQRIAEKKEQQAA